MSDGAKAVAAAVSLGLIAVLFHISAKEEEECRRKGGTLVRMQCIDRNAIIE